jgi:quinol monooxygenase YgiN
VQPSPAIRFFVQIQVHGIERFTALVARCVEVSGTEPGTIHYDWFLDGATGATRLVEAYD